VLDDPAAPAAGALLGLELVLEEMSQEDDEAALDRLLVLARHRLDLFDQIGQIEVVEPTFAQQRGLLLEPETEIALVQRRLLVGQSFRACHVSSPCPASTPPTSRRRSARG
jgi:hypothetical protein